NNGLQVLFDTRNALFQGTPVRLDLCFTGTAEETKTAPLALQVGPTADKATLLVIEMSKLDLQRTFPRMRPLPEYLEDESRAVDDLCLPLLLKIALLHR